MICLFMQIYILLCVIYDTVCHTTTGYKDTLLVAGMISSQELADIIEPARSRVLQIRIDACIG